MKYDGKNLNEVIEEHRKYLTTLKGDKADFGEIREPYFTVFGAFLPGAHFVKADVHNGKLSMCCLDRANFIEANLTQVDFRGSTLREADFAFADLEGVNFDCADLYGANFKNAFNIPYIPMACPSHGSFTGWKKAYIFDEGDLRFMCLVELEIPEDAERSSATTRKCRCDKAKVLSIRNMQGLHLPVRTALSLYDEEFKYPVGETVEVPYFDEDRWNECSTGIHFFVNMEDAARYTG